jgi:hypothetical protein
MLVEGDRLAVDEVTDRKKTGRMVYICVQWAGEGRLRRGVAYIIRPSTRVSGTIVGSFDLIVCNA